MSACVLVVDDEPDLLASLVYRLEKEGFNTRSATCATEAIREAQRSPHPELVVLDLMLPDRPGTEVCRELRAHPYTQHVPILMLTARGEEIDRVVGFEMGADDYLVKPCSMREFVLRVRAILRRSRAASETSGDQLNLGILRIEESSHRVFVDNREAQLTALEFRLLLTLVRRHGRVQTRSRLLHDVWGIEATLTTRTVDTHIKRLREKLGVAGRYIETLRGVGYRCCDPAEADAA